VAETITIEDIPSAWRNTPIVHLGPIAREISPEIALSFPNSLIGVTPQGWLREWDEEGIVSYCCWPDAVEVLKHAHAAVMSIEDVRGDEEIVAEFASILPILVVTEGAQGSRVYWNGDLRTFRPPQEIEVDPVGAGDIFATSFFIRLRATNDPWESARYATLLAANSVTRRTTQGVPTPEEVRRFAAVVIDQKP
jgi:sugar/nucleoside kinase (ribokinase family)